MSLQGGMALTSSKVRNIKCILILIFLAVICSGIPIPYVFGKTMERLHFSLLDRFNHWALKEGEGLCGCLISSGSQNWKRKVQALGVSSDSPSAVQQYDKWQAQRQTQDGQPISFDGCQMAVTAMEGHSDLNVWALLGSFHPGNIPPYRELLPEESEKDLKWNRHKERSPATLVWHFLGKSYVRKKSPVSKALSLQFAWRGRMLS